MEQISWADFEKVELRVGTIIDVQPFPEARKPAYKLKIDFGEYGIKQSSAQITERYSPKDLMDRQILAVINFPKKQIANFFSECLTTGVPDEEGKVVLLSPLARVPNGAKLF
jgi:tRNA-binding protein